MEKKLILLSFFMWIACQSPTPKELPLPNDFDLAKVKEQITEANKIYSIRFLQNDTAFITDKYCIDAAIYPVGRPAIIGRDSIGIYYYDKGQNQNMNINIVAYAIYGDQDMVVEEGLFDFPDGKGGSYDQGKFIALWKEEDNKWKLFREIWNSDRPTVQPVIEK